MAEPSGCVVVWLCMSGSKILLAYCAQFVKLSCVSFSPMLGPGRALSLVALVNAGSSLIHGPWSDVLKSPEARAQALVANMTLTEKIMMMQASNN